MLAVAHEAHLRHAVAARVRDARDVDEDDRAARPRRRRVVELRRGRAAPRTPACPPAAPARGRAGAGSAAAPRTRRASRRCARSRARGRRLGAAAIRVEVGDRVVVEDPQAPDRALRRDVDVPASSSGAVPTKNSACLAIQSRWCVLDALEQGRHRSTSLDDVELPTRRSGPTTAIATSRPARMRSGRSTAGRPRLGRDQVGLQQHLARGVDARLRAPARRAGRRRACRARRSPRVRRSIDGTPSSSSRPWMNSASAWWRAPATRTSGALGVLRLDLARPRVALGHRLVDAGRPRRRPAACRTRAEALVEPVRGAAPRADERRQSHARPRHLA